MPLPFFVSHVVIGLMERFLIQQVERRYFVGSYSRYVGIKSGTSIVLTGGKGMGKQAYMSRVPRCCSWQTWEEHFDAGLCWSVARGLKNKESDCDGCDMRRLPKKEVCEKTSDAMTSSPNTVP